MNDANRFLELGLAQLWQVTVLAAVVWLIVRTVARHRPYLAYVLWTLVLVKCLTPPLISSPGGIFSWAQGQISQCRVEPAPPEIVDSAQAFEPGEIPWLHQALPSTDDSIHVELERRENEFGRELDRGIAAFEKPTLVERERNQYSIGATALLAIWLGGAFALFVLTLSRTVICLRRIYRTRVETPRDLSDAFERLRGQLGIRQAVKLVVSSSLIGPAVIGLTRPTIVIPRLMIQRFGIREIEPILAHELTHIRRKDLWFGAVQAVAQIFWWFHPLVWIANRLATREVERCCDEEAIAGMRISPADYARGLIRVLECRNLLASPAPFPAVRPVDLTSKRLERIMSLRQGCHQKMPVVYWMLVIALGAVVLPGAARAVVPSVQESKVDEAEATDGVEKAAAAITVLAYQVEDLITQFKENYQIPRVEAKKQLLSYVQRLGTKVIVDPILREGKRRAGREPKDSARYAWNGEKDQLIVCHNRKGHERIKRGLSATRKIGYSVVVLRIKAFQCKADTATQILEWVKEDGVKEFPTTGSTSINADCEQSETADGGLFGKHWLRSEGSETAKKVACIRDEYELAKQFIIDVNQHRKLESFIDGVGNGELMVAPTVVVPMGVTVAVSNSAYRPFVVGIEKRQPTIGLICEGSRYAIRVTGSSPDDLNLRMESQQITIGKVENQMKEGQPIQIPSVHVARLLGDAPMKAGKPLLMVGIPGADANVKDSLVLLVESEEVLPQVLSDKSSKKKYSEPVEAPVPLLSQIPTISRLFENRMAAPVDVLEATSGEVAKELFTREYDVSALVKWDDDKAASLRKQFKWSFRGKQSFFDMNQRQRMEFVAADLLNGLGTDTDSRRSSVSKEEISVDYDRSKLIVCQTLENHRRIAARILRWRNGLARTLHVKVRGYQLDEKAAQELCRGRQQFSLDDDGAFYFHKAATGEYRASASDAKKLVLFDEGRLQWDCRKFFGDIGATRTEYQACWTGDIDRDQAGVAFRFFHRDQMKKRTIGNTMDALEPGDFIRFSTASPSTHYVDVTEAIGAKDEGSRFILAIQAKIEADRDLASRTGEDLKKLPPYTYYARENQIAPDPIRR